MAKSCWARGMQNPGAPRLRVGTMFAGMLAALQCGTCPRSAAREAAEILRTR